jgi:hypothetical protein
MRHFAQSFCLLTLSAVALAAAGLPYAGKWKINPAKSQFTEATTTYEQTGPGEMRMTAEGQSYKFKVDGKEYPAVYGSTAVWKQIDPNTWQTTYTINGKVYSVDTTNVSADGRTMTVLTKMEQGGKSVENTVTLERVSGGPGLAGKWKTTKVKMDSPETLELVANGEGMTLHFAEMQASCKTQFDGKDYGCTGSLMPPGFTMALKKTGDRGFDMTEKMNGKVIYTAGYSLSADGKTLTLVAVPAGTDEKIKIVYDRQ